MSKDPLEKEMATHSSILAGEIPGTEEPSGLHPRGCKESDTTEQLNNNNLRRLLQGFKQHKKINVELASFSLSDPSLLLMGGPPTPPHPCHTSVPSHPQMLTAA